MTDDGKQHAACVRDWIDGAARDLPPAQRLALFERGLSAVWARARRTLGDVTLGAITERVLHDVSEAVPLASAIEPGEAGISLEKLRDRPDLERLDEAVERTLVALMTLIGNLTAEILTPALHAALAKVSLEQNEGLLT